MTVGHPKKNCFLLLQKRHEKRYGIFKCWTLDPGQLKASALALYLLETCSQLQQNNLEGQITKRFLRAYRISLNFEPSASSLMAG
jgi:hypothetical protein